jgi:hypothetical protein
MTDQNPQQPSEAGDGGEPVSGSGYPPPSGSGSIYESSAYNQPPPEQEPTPSPSPSPEPTPPPEPTAPYAGGPPPGYAYPAAPAAPQRNNTQLFGILGIVLAVVCCPLLGILFGWLSMNEAKKTGSDDTLGKVGFWLGIAITAIGLVTTIIAICAGGISGWNDNNW